MYLLNRGGLGTRSVVPNIYQHRQLSASNHETFLVVESVYRSTVGFPRAS